MSAAKDFYPEITEQIGDPVSEEERRRLFDRYHWVRDYCANKHVLEIACGTAQGLNFLVKTAPATGVGGDVSATNLVIAKQNFPQLDLQKIDAHHLPFGEQSFDVIVMLEALYFLDSPRQFLAEARRVMRAGGKLLLTINNKDMFNFSPSSFGKNYFGVPDIVSFLRENGFTADVWGGIAVPKTELRQSVLGMVKTVVTKLGLLPKTKRGKRLLKKIMYGEQTPLEAQIPMDYARPNLTKLDAHLRNSQYKILYVAATPI
jgi:SAM-dependent methyltransferase